ncbi:MAG TPA: FkbM family methyltransferase [Solirubrobacteraceae bacterium]|jgi:FkbM family methyltransferase
MSLHGPASRALLQWTPLRHRATRKRLVHARRRVYEAVGSARYSRPGHDELDAKLERYLPKVGTFLEAGANDGYTWSNTYYLERLKGWSGVLIEGIPVLSEECRRRRPRSRVYNCALVAADFPDEYVTMRYSDLRSLIKGSEPQIEALIDQGPERAYEVRVPARTLDQVLDEAGVEHIDFISLDLEGHEASALRGLDLDRRRPTWLLIEVANGEHRAGVERVLGDRYEAVDDLTPGDVLYRRV